MELISVGSRVRALLYPFTEIVGRVTAEQEHMLQVEVIGPLNWEAYPPIGSKHWTPRSLCQPA